jgi:hypothetical protein
VVAGRCQHLVALEEELEHLLVMGEVEVLQAAVVAVHRHRHLAIYTSPDRAKKVDSAVIQAKVFLML